jgi:UDP-glucose 4-epimerase
MKILITGSAGFIGSYVVGEFLKAGWDVVGLDNGSIISRSTANCDRHTKATLATGSSEATRRM